MAKLSLGDITDLRAYEREREAFRAHVIACKSRRRVEVGPVVTLVFENADTIRFQIQEMARVEKITTDAGIEAELRVYNPLIPEPGHLAATLFIELTTEVELREWLPKLVGIERHVVLRFGGAEVRCTVDADHEGLLTRESVTASVHYVHFACTPSEVAAFGTGPVVLAIDHPQYRHEALLGPGTVAELAHDLREGG